MGCYWLVLIFAPGVGRNFVSWIFSIRISPTIQRYHFIPTYTSFANRTNLSVRSGLHPLMNARPTEKVSTHGDHSIPSHVQTDVTLKCPFSLIISFFIIPRTIAVATIIILVGRVSVCSCHLLNLNFLELLLCTFATQLHLHLLFLV